MLSVGFWVFAVTCGLMASGLPAARSDDGPAAADGPDADAMPAKIGACWSVPSGSLGKVRLAFKLNRDGSLMGRPEVVFRPAGPAGDQLAASAVRAVRRCAPFRLPAAQYDEWKEMVVTFDPSELQ